LGVDVADIGLAGPAKEDLVLGMAFGCGLFWLEGISEGCKIAYGEACRE
jgi:hypothetical protein